MFAAVGAGDGLFLDVIGHLLIAPAGHIGAVKILDEVIGTMTGLTFLTVHQRVREAAEMTGSNPCLGIHEDSGIKTDIVLVFLDEFFKPGGFDVILECHT